MTKVSTSNDEVRDGCYANGRVEATPGKSFHVPSSTFLLNGHRVTDFQHTEETTKGNPTQGYIAVQVHPGGDWIDGNKARLRHTVLSVRPQT